VVRSCRRVRWKRRWTVMPRPPARLPACARRSAVAVVKTEGGSCKSRFCLRTASFVMGVFLLSWIASGRQPAINRVAPSQLPPIASVLASMLATALARDGSHYGVLRRHSSLQPADAVTTLSCRRPLPECGRCSHGC
jgi:hypothetical protein